MKEYYLGLDMGTASVGWAVTDTSYNLLRAKGKDLWGVRLFEEAETAAGRRTHRVSRRRRQREVARIGLLKEFFSDEIGKIDANFFERLEESKYHREDKKIESKYAIFADKEYSDAEYFKQYPTIFHLRKELIESNQKHDVRLVYLALLNMFKRRGHFLNKNLDATEENKELPKLFEEMTIMYSEIVGNNIHVNVEMDKIEELLSKKDISKTKKAEEIANVLGISRSKQKSEYEVIKAIVGLTFSLYTLLQDTSLEEHKKQSLNFSESSYEEKVVEAQALVSENAMDFISVLKQIHDYGLLSSVMKGYNYLSQARVELYEKHKYDLQLLKRVIKTHCPEEYDNMFRLDTSSSYSAYVGSTNSGKKIRRSMSEGKRDDLYKSLKKHLSKMPAEDEDVIYLINEINTENLLPKQLTSSNGVIPNQVHYKEIEAILKNAEQYHDFLKQQDETGLSITEKILQIYKFQIPYYIGPLSDQHKDNGGNAWLVKKENGPIYPWNFSQKIDERESAELFIMKMVKHCSYLSEEKALPKNSLFYEKFMVLNELNNLRIRGEKPSVELKQAIYKDLFEQGKKVKQKQLQKYLCGQGILAEDELDAISGIDGDFKASLSSWGKFLPIFAEELHKDHVQAVVEEIIYWGTIYGEDKRFLKERITGKYGDELTKEQIDRITGYKFKDWGRLSKSFLELGGSNKIDGEILSIIQKMWHTNCNLMELLSEEYTYVDELRDKCIRLEKTLQEFEYDDLDDMYLSAPVKRMVWQTILVLNDIEKVLGGGPKKIFVEMTRSDGEKNRRTQSRKAKFMELYKGCKEDGRQWSKEIDAKTEAEFRSKKLFLYYTQKGCCMYSGNPIDLNDLFKDNLYDIDHIYPRHFVKDDSIINNLVLVEKNLNAHKSDTYPLEDDIYKKQKNFWRSLLTQDYKDNFITREKYNRLINRNPFSDEELAGFINRQIVETGQGTKTITNILNMLYQGSRVVYVKAGNVSEFRREKYLKCRSVNDFHHAQDAYLNIVVGNVYDVKFTKSPINFIKNYRKDKDKNKYSLNRMFDFTVTNNGEVAWIADKREQSSRNIVDKVMRKNSPLITKMTLMGHGGLADQTLYSAKKAKETGYIPLKSSDERMGDVTKYGGFSGAATAFFTLVEHTQKEKRVRSLEAIPLYLLRFTDNLECKMLEFCEKNLGLNNPSIHMSRIPIQSLIKRNGYCARIAGKSNKQIIVHNASPLCVRHEWAQYVKKVESSVEKQRVLKEITRENNILIYKIFLQKHMEGLYQMRPNPVGIKLEEGMGRFTELTELEQCRVIMQIVQLSALNNLGADLSEIGQAKKTGVMLINKVISNESEFNLICQSPSGLYQREIDLLTV